MRRFRRLFSFASALALLGAASVTYALGFGQIQLQSALNQPLDARVPLLAVKPEERDQVSVTIADPETFRRFGIERPAILDQIEIEVVQASDPSRLNVQMRSRVPIQEPFLTFLMEADWPDGRAIREYTVLLDPPVSEPRVSAPVPTQQANTPVSRPASAPVRAARSAPPLPEPPQQQIASPAPREPARPAVSTSDRSQARTRPAQRTQPRRPAPRPAPTTAAPEPESEPEVFGTDDFEPDISDPVVRGEPTRSYGPVKAGETLWRIANATLPASGVTLNQTMLGIYLANLSAFDGNINQIRKGSVLTIPAKTELAKIDVLVAKAEIDDQMSAPEPAATNVAKSNLSGEAAQPQSGAKLRLEPASEASPEVDATQADEAAASAANQAPAAQRNTSNTENAQASADQSAETPTEASATTQTPPETLAGEPADDDNGSAAQTSGGDNTASVAKPEVPANQTGGDRANLAGDNEQSPSAAGDTRLADASAATALPDSAQSDDVQANQSDASPAPDVAPSESASTTSDVRAVDEGETASSPLASADSATSDGPESNGEAAPASPDSGSTASPTNEAATTDSVADSAQPNRAAAPAQQTGTTAGNTAAPTASAGSDSAAPVKANLPAAGAPPTQDEAESGFIITPQHILIGLAVLLLLVALLVRWLRNRSQDNESGHGSAPSFATGGAGLAAAAASSNAAASSQTQDSAVAESPDSQAEIGELLEDADSHIAFELYDEALDALQLGLEAHPGHPAIQRKILEVHYAAGERDAFMRKVDVFFPNASPQDPDWQRVSAMGYELAPDDDRFQPPDEAASSDIPPPTTEESGPDSAAETADSLRSDEDPFADFNDSDDLDIPTYGAPAAASAAAASSDSPADTRVERGEDDLLITGSPTQDSGLEEPAEPPGNAPTAGHDAGIDAGIDEWTRELQELDEQSEAEAGRESDLLDDPFADDETPAQAGAGDAAAPDRESDDISLDFDFTEFDGGDSGSAASQTESDDEFGLASSDEARPGDANRDEMEILDFDLDDLQLTDEPASSTGSNLDPIEGDATNTPLSPETAELSDTDSDLSLPGDDEPEPPASAFTPAPDDKAPGELSIEDIRLDDDAPEPAQSWADSEVAPEPEPERDDDFMDFDLGETGTADNEPSLTDADADGSDSMSHGADDALSTDEEIVTKLDLARAYLDMGESEMAVSLLEEVQSQGNTEQQGEAQALLAQIK